MTDYVDLSFWKDKLDTVADSLLGLGLSEICSINIETNGATGGVDVTIEGVPHGDDDDINSMIFETRTLRITNHGVEVVS